MGPHITVLAPDRPAIPIVAAASTFKSLELRILPFQISAHEVHVFSRHHRHTLVLLPDNPVPLTSLFNAVLERCNWQDTTASTKRPYQPHVTLINQVPDHQLEPVQNQLSNLRPNVESFECSQLALYAKQTSWQTWKELARLALS